MGDQLAVGEQHDPGEQRQHVGQRVGVLPVSGRKDSYDVSEFGRDHSSSSAVSWSKAIEVARDR